MLLRSITKHVKDQNWFAVFLDFFIVVAGILIAFQITNWNEAKSKSRMFDQQLISFQEELEINFEMLGRYKERSERQLAEINELRAALKDDASQIEPARFNALMFQAVLVPNYRPTSTAYEDLVASGTLREVSGTPLRRAIAEWEADTSVVQRLDQDALTFRNNITLPFVISEMSYGAIAGGDERIKKHGFATIRFDSNILQAAQNQELDSHLTLVFTIEAEKLARAKELLTSTEALISAIDGEPAQ